MRLAEVGCKIVGDKICSNSGKSRCMNDQVFGKTLRSVRELVDGGLIEASAEAGLAAVEARYAIAITPEFAARMSPVLARQFLPSVDELTVAAGEVGDPTGDAAHSPVVGVVHRYPDRALLKPLLICPVYCRFCFRREHVGPDGGVLGEAELEAAFGYLAGQSGLREVILTGGDPLMLSPRRLAAILGRLAAMKQIEILRIHTRVPLADPGRVSVELVEALGAAGDKARWVGVHINHAEEFSEAGAAALARLSRAGMALLGQTVLLRGVNDSVEALGELFRAMLRHRIKPYYLHQMDAAPGTAQFYVPIEEGLALMRGLRGRISGMGLPTYILDIEGGYGKIPLGPGYLDGQGGMQDPFGGQHVLAEGSFGG